MPKFARSLATLFLTLTTAIAPALAKSPKDLAFQHGSIEANADTTAMKICFANDDKCLWFGSLGTNHTGNAASCSRENMMAMLMAEFPADKYDRLSLVRMNGVSSWKRFSGGAFQPGITYDVLYRDCMPTVKYRQGFVCYIYTDPSFVDNYAFMDCGAVSEKIKLNHEIIVDGGDDGDDDQE